MQKYEHNYSSDITREQFEIIRTELECAKKTTKPRSIDLYSESCPTPVKPPINTQPKLQDVYDKSDNYIMHFYRFGKADSFSDLSSLRYD